RTSSRWISSPQSGTRSRNKKSRSSRAARIASTSTSLGRILRRNVKQRHTERHVPVGALILVLISLVAAEVGHVAKTTRSLQAHRAAGGDRHHRGSDRPSGAGGAKGSRGRQPGCLPKQPEADLDRQHELRKQLSYVSPRSG